MDITDTSPATPDNLRPLPSQRRLARPGLHRVQPAPRCRSRRRGPAREGPLGDPAHPAGRHPGPVATIARRLVLHLPTDWPWAPAWQDLWATATTT